MIQTMKPVLIEKEDILVVNFTKPEASIESSKIISILNELEKAVILGNSENHVKVKTTFATSNGLRMVETTIWQSDSAGITLKGGVLIPIKSITDVTIL